MSTIFCFSTTGNCLYTAKKIAERIPAQVISMTGMDIQCDDDIIGFVYPTYFGSMPQTVMRFISRLNITNKKAYIFGIATYGSILPNVAEILMNQSVILNEILSPKMVALSYYKPIQSVQNYIPGHVVNDMPEIQAKTDEGIEEAIRNIVERKQITISGDATLIKEAYKNFPGLHGECDKLFSVSNQCIGCGSCSKICPVHNIRMENKRPSFQHQCEHCLGCLHICPVAAIDWNNQTVGKKRHRNRNISKQELIAFNNIVLKP